MKVLLILAAWHYVGDFILQSDEMALNKSSSWFWLAVHVLTYTMMVSCGFLTLELNHGYVARFFIMTFVTHFVTDAVTSRVSAKLYVNNQRHWFFCTIGFDQLVHLWTLGATIAWLGLVRW
jgi:phage-related holin